MVYQDLVKINKACESGDILKNQEIINAYSYAQKTGDVYKRQLLDEGKIKEGLKEIHYATELLLKIVLNNKMCIRDSIRNIVTKLFFTASFPIYLPHFFTK